MNVTLSQEQVPFRLSFDKPVTDEGLVRFSQLNEGLRVERDQNGELIVMSAVGMEGGGAETDAATELTVWARKDGRGRAFGSNTGFRLPDGSIRMADAMWVSWKKIESVTPKQRKGFAAICPEFVIEVRSETDGLVALRKKMKMWIANGADLAWLVDPARRVVEVYRTGETVEIHENPSSVQGDGPVGGFELVMSSIWR